MTAQTNAAAERSAHVLRAHAVPADKAALHPVLETRNEAGQTVGQLRAVVELREENARLREALRRVYGLCDALPDAARLEAERTISAALRECGA